VPTIRLLILGFIVAAALPAAVITDTQGAQGFLNGIQLDVFDYLTGNAGEVAPFDLESGFDADDGDGGSNFDVVWTHSYAIPLQPIVGASLRIGLYEHESDDLVSQVASLTLNGQFGPSLTALLDAQVESYGGSTVYDPFDGFPVTTEYNIYTIALPAAVFSELAGGSAQFRLQLQGPGVNLFGVSQYNGAFIDFAELTMTEVPEPSTLLLIGAALPLLALLRRR